MNRLMYSVLFVVGMYPAHGEDGLRELPDQSIYAKDGLFLKVALLDDPKAFVSEWMSGRTKPALRTKTVFHRGDVVFPAVMFSTKSLNPEGKAHIEYTLLFRRPDGSIYEHLQNLTVVNGPPSNEIALSKDRAGLKIEETDPFGDYTLKATITDKVKEVSVEMLFTFSVVDPAAKPVDPPAPVSREPEVLPSPTPHPTTRMRPFSSSTR